jgi:NAD-dependent oxidoreductase involved in siderophore biosynthesis
LLARQNACLLITAEVTLRSLYSGLDLLARTADSDSLRLDAVVVRRGDVCPAFSLTAGRIPVRMQLPLRVSTKDDGTDLIGGHRITAHFPDRQLTLEGPAGPIVELRTPAARGPVWRIMDPPGNVTWSDYYHVRMATLRRSLLALCRANAGPPGARHTVAGQEHARLISIARCWEQILSKAR